MTLAAKLKGRRERWIKNVCRWCGKPFKATRSGVQTDTNRCRLNLHRFRKETGFDPERPPGELSAGEALDLLIIKLIARERDRLAAERGL